MWLRTGSTWTKCGSKTMLLPLFLIWVVITYSYSEVWELLMICCNRWCVMLNHYDLGLFSVWFEIPHDFVDYRSYMGSSLRIWSLRWLFLDLCSYNLDGSVTRGLSRNDVGCLYVLFLNGLRDCLQALWCFHCHTIMGFWWNDIRNLKGFASSKVVEHNMHRLQRTRPRQWIGLHNFAF
jgi:hypothetical protein